MGKIDLSHKEQLFRTQIGQAATVQRERMTPEQAEMPGRKLSEIGVELNILPANLKYMGSAAVHIYWNETLEQVFFLNQTTRELASSPEVLTSKAFDDLLREMKELYGRKSGRLRSGF